MPVTSLPPTSSALICNSLSSKPTTTRPGLLFNSQLSASASLRRGTPFNHARHHRHARPAKARPHHGRRRKSGARRTTGLSAPSNRSGSPQPKRYAVARRNNRSHAGQRVRPQRHRQLLRRQLSIPLRIFDRNQGEKERTRYEVESSRFAVTAARNQVVSDVDQAWLALDTAQHSGKTL